MNIRKLKRTILRNAGRLMRRDGYTITADGKKFPRFRALSGWGMTFDGGEFHINRRAARV